MSKKFMVRCDIEGVSGVVNYEQAEPGKSEYIWGQEWFMSDLIALVSGLNAGGADEVHIYDEHCHGRNIIIDKLPEKTTVYCGKPPYLPNWAGGLDDTFAGLILLGFHSKRGTKNALLNHSYEPDIRDIQINGVSVGEIGVEAAIAGDYDVPLIMLTADSEGVKEAQSLVPGVVGVTVKESLSEYGAACYSLDTTYKMIFETAKNVAQNLPTVKPYTLHGDIVFTFDFFDTPYAGLYDELFKTRTIQGNTATECWAEYWANKLKVQSLL